MRIRTCMTCMHAGKHKASYITNTSTMADNYYARKHSDVHAHVHNNTHVSTFTMCIITYIYT